MKFKIIIAILLILIALPPIVYGGAYFLGAWLVLRPQQGQRR